MFKPGTSTGVELPKRLPQHLTPPAGSQGAGVALAGSDGVPAPRQTQHLDRSWSLPQPRHRRHDDVAADLVVSRIWKEIIGVPAWRELEGRDAVE